PSMPSDRIQRRNEHKAKIGSAPILQWGDRLTLETWSRRPEFPAALKRWAQLILACAEGKTNATVSREVGITQLTVGKWRRQFVAAPACEWFRRSPLDYSAFQSRFDLLPVNGLA